MKKIAVLFLLTCFINRPAVAQTATLSPADLQPLTGYWRGTITYLDYTTNKPFTMPADVEIGQIGNRSQFSFANNFPEEKNANWIDTFTISGGGTMLNDEAVISKTLLADGSLQLITQNEGVDGNDNKPALFRHTYIIGSNIFSKRKDVQFKGSTEWIQRHEYRYTTRGRLLTPAQMKKELGIIRSVWENIHPGTYRYNTPAQVAGYFSVLDRQTNTETEQQRFLMLLSQLAAKMKCGHTYLNYWNQEGEVKNQFFSATYLPLLFRVIDKKFIVTHNLSENKSIKPGDEITSINGIATRRIIDSLLTVSRSDGNNSLAKKLYNMNVGATDIEADNYALFDIYFPLFFSVSLTIPEYRLEIKGPKNVTQKIAVKSVSKKERQQAYEKQFGAIPVREKNWAFNIIKPGVALLKIGDFETWEWKTDYKKYLDSVFNIISTSNIKNLIVDIRGNEGGDDDARNNVLSYIANKPFGCGNPLRSLYKFLSVPDSIAPYLETWNEENKKPKKEADYNKVAGGWYEEKAAAQKACVPILPHPNAFKGTVFLITNAANSSTGFTLADIFSQYQFGKMVGETTGGTKQGLNGGRFFTLRLPHSKLEMDIPIIYGPPAIARPDEATTPGYPVKTTAATIAAGKDVPVGFILKQLIK
jgi:hypothetical protein